METNSYIGNRIHPLGQGKRERERERDRQRDRERDRERQRETERETEREENVCRENVDNRNLFLV